MTGEAIKLLAEYFPDFRDWVVRSGAKSPGYTRVIESRLSSAPEWALRRACEELLGSGDATRPHRIPFLVADRAKRLCRNAETGRLRAATNGQETYACLRCRDSGLVTIYHPRTLALARRGELVPGRVYTAAAACTCEAGRRYPWLLRYDPARDLVVPEPEPAVEEAIATIERHVRHPMET